VHAALGVFRSADNELETADGYSLTARLTGLPIYEDDESRLLHLGAWATLRSPVDDELQFRSRPESKQAENFVDTGVFETDQDVRAGLELGTVRGPWFLQSELTFAAPDTSGDPVFPSAYVSLSRILTGEHRRYRRGIGTFGTVQPESPFLRGGAGAWELASRYSYLDLDSGDIGGTLHDWTLGLNWFLNDNERLMFNYVAAHPEGFDFEHILQMRLQVIY
jgi:phosphate-selective porin OprO/OprP